MKVSRNFASNFSTLGAMPPLVPNKEDEEVVKQQKLNFSVKIKNYVILQKFLGIKESGRNDNINPNFAKDLFYLLFIQAGHIDLQC